MNIYNNKNLQIKFVLNTILGPLEGIHSVLVSVVEAFLKILPGHLFLHVLLGISVHLLQGLGHTGSGGEILTERHNVGPTRLRLEFGQFGFVEGVRTTMELLRDRLQRSSLLDTQIVASLLTADIRMIHTDTSGDHLVS